MKNVYVSILFFMALVPVTCTMPDAHKDEKIVETKKAVHRDPFHALCQYWDVSDAESPAYSDLYDQHEEGVYNYPGIIFMTDSTFLENPKAIMRYGKFALKGKVITAVFDDGTKATYTIQSIQGQEMILSRVEKGHTTILHVKGDHVFWPQASLNPFNKINSVWRMKPSATENDDALRNRLKGCVQFYEYYFRGVGNSDADEIDFLGLPTCFNWYQGGISVQNEKKLDKKFVNCFYSPAQALQARQMMEDVILKKYDWDTTQKNWLLQTADVLKQIHDKM